MEIVDIRQVDKTINGLKGKGDHMNRNSFKTSLTFYAIFNKEGFKGDPKIVTNNFDKATEAEDGTEKKTTKLNYICGRRSDS